MRGMCFWTGDNVPCKHTSAFHRPLHGRFAGILPRCSCVSSEGCRGPEAPFVFGGSGPHFGLTATLESQQRLIAHEWDPCLFLINLQGEDRKDLPRQSQRAVALGLKTTPGKVSNT